MTQRPESSEYTPIVDEEASWPEADSDEKLLDRNLTALREQSNWKPIIHCNTAASILVAMCATLTVLATFQFTLWYERRGSNAPRWRPAFCEYFFYFFYFFLTASNSH